MDFSSGVFAIFINDLKFSDSKIGDYKFYYDSDSNSFIVKSKPELRYPRSAVAKNPQFLVFRETNVVVPVTIDGFILEEITDDLEVDLYEMSEY